MTKKADKPTPTPNPLPLAYPFEFAGEHITSIELRRPRMSDHIAHARLKTSDEEREVNFMARLAEMKTDAMEMIDEHDFARLQAIVTQMRSENEEKVGKP